MNGFQWFVNKAQFKKKKKSQAFYKPLRKDLNFHQILQWDHDSKKVKKHYFKIQ